MSESTSPRRTNVFLLVWFGQMISLVGSGLTGFALGVWVYQGTGSVTQFALVALFETFPAIALSPFAGALVDRWDRRKVMLVSDVVTGLATLAVAVLFATGRIEVWQLYVTNAIASVCGAFRWPAYTASTSLLVPEKHLGRANGLIQMAFAISQIFAPVIAAVLLGFVSIQYLVLIDFATFVFSIITLLPVQFPAPKASAEAAAAQGSLWSEAKFGWTFIRARNGLFGLLAMFALTNFLISIVTVLATPLVLTITTVAALGTVLAIAGSGMLVGSLVMTAWGGPRPRIYGVLGFMFLESVCLILAGARPSVVLLSVAAFIFFFGAPIVNSSSQAIWQSKVPPDIQGRVFAVRTMIALSTLPLANLLAGPLADRVFEPLMVVNGPLAASIGPLIGVGPGRGIGLLFIVFGIFSFIVVLLASLNSRIRYVERELPDVLPATPETASPRTVSAPETLRVSENP